MSYELWDLASRNLIGEYATLDEAIADLHESIEYLGIYAALRDVALGEVADDGTRGRSWAGDALAALLAETGRG